MTINKTILYVAHENTKGGATHSLLNLLDNLPSNIEPFVLLPKTLSFQDKFGKHKKALLQAGTLEEDLIKRNIKYVKAYYFYDNLDYPLNILKKKFFFIVRKRELNRIAKFVIDKKIDVIHSNSSVIKFGSDLAELTKTQHVWHIRENPKPMLGISVENLKDYCKNIIEKSDAIIFISEQLRNDFMEMDPNFLKNSNKLLTIYNGIPLSKNNIPYQVKNNFNIFCFSTIYEIKGQEDLVDLAIKMRSNNILDFRIYLVGERKKEYFSFLKKKISSNNLEDIITFIDYTIDLTPLRVQADLEIVCSRDEAFGRVAVETLNFGNPLIVTDVGGLSEIVEHKQSGLKYTPGNIEELYNCVSMIRNNEVDVERLLERGKIRASQFDIKICVNNITRLYEARS